MKARPNIATISSCLIDERKRGGNRPQVFADPRLSPSMWEACVDAIKNGGVHVLHGPSTFHSMQVCLLTEAFIMIQSVWGQLCHHTGLVLLLDLEFFFFEEI